MNILLGNALASSLRSHFNKLSQAVQSDSVMQTSLGKFVSTEAFSEIKEPKESFLGKPVTVIQSLGAVGDSTANDLAMQLLLTIRTLKRNGAGPIWVVMPFMAFGRQDRSFEGRITSIAIDDFAFFLKKAGALGVSTIEMHSEAAMKHMRKRFGQDQVYNLDPTSIFIDDIKTNIGIKNVVVGGPDDGANARADAVAVALPPMP